MRIFFRFPVIFAVCLAVYGQSAPKPEFEVASVKPAAESRQAGPAGPGRARKMLKAGRRTPSPSDPSRFTASGISLFALLLSAYDLQPYQISGPDWLNNALFDVNARIPEGAPKAQFGPMLQTLLADRFKLVVHHESRQMTVYDLAIAKSGPKIKIHADSAPAAEVLPPGPARPVKTEVDAYGLPASPMFGTHGTSTVRTPDRARMWAFGETMPELAKMLSNELSKPVGDSTGLTGKYDFILSWAPDSPPQPTDGASDPVSLPTLLAAVQEQLGLRLEQKKGPVEILVVDHAEKVPTEN